MAEQATILEMPAAEPPKQSAHSSSTIQELKALLRQSSHYILGFVGSLLLGFISFPVTTRVFSIADFGMLDLIQRTLLLAVAFGKMGMQNSVFREFHGEAFAADPLKEKRFYSTMLLGTAGISMAVSILCGIGVRLVPARWMDQTLAGYLSLFAALIFVRSLQSILWGFLRIEEKTKTYNILNFVLKAVSVGVILLFLFTISTTVKSYYMASMVVEFGSAALLTVGLYRRGLIGFGWFDKNLFTAAVAFGFPLILQELSGILLDSGDRFLVKAYLGATPLGLYSAAYGVSSYVRTFLETPMSLAILPIYLRLWRTQGKEKTSDFLSQVLNGYFFVAALIFAVAAVSAKDALILLASAKYSESAHLIPLLVAGILIYAGGSICNAGLIIQKKTGTLAWLMLAAAVLNIGLNMILLPRIGLNGAAIATLISFAAWLAATAVFSYRVLPLQLNARGIIVYISAAAITWLAFSSFDLHSTLLNLAVKPVGAFLCFALLSYLGDPQMRIAVRWGVNKLSRLNSGVAK